MIIGGMEFILAPVSEEIFRRYLKTHMTNPLVGLELMAVCQICIEGQCLFLTEDVINKYVKNWEILTRLELAIVEYNCTHFLPRQIFKIAAALAK